MLLANNLMIVLMNKAINFLTILSLFVFQEVLVGQNKQVAPVEKPAILPSSGTGENLSELFNINKYKTLEASNSPVRNDFNGKQMASKKLTTEEIKDLEEFKRSHRLDRLRFIDLKELFPEGEFNRLDMYKHTYGGFGVTPYSFSMLDNHFFDRFMSCARCWEEIELGMSLTECKDCRKGWLHINPFAEYYIKSELSNLKRGVCCVLQDNSSLREIDGKTQLKTVRYDSCNPKFPESGRYKKVALNHMPVVKNSGTGFLIKDNLVLTAAHNLGDREAADLSFVFSYHPGIARGRYEIIKGKCVVRRGYRVYDKRGNVMKDNNGAVLQHNYFSMRKKDWVIIELERAPKDPYVHKLGKLKRPVLNKNVFMLGHPRGLPLMMTFGAEVYKIVKLEGSNFDDLVLCNLDAFKGNSGSPVYSRDSLNVIGMLIEGKEDVNSEGELATSNSDLSSSGEYFIELDEMIDYMKSYKRGDCEK